MNEENLKAANVEVNPETGENKILSTEEIKHDSLDDIIDASIENMKSKLNEEKTDKLISNNISEKDVISYLAENPDSAMIEKLLVDTDLKQETVAELLKIINRRMKGEKFNLYKEMPKEIQDVVDSYMAEGGLNQLSNYTQFKTIRNSVTEALIDGFIEQVELSKAKDDFAVELEGIYKTAAKDLSDTSLGLIEERNKAYREAVDEIEDEDKRRKLIEILDVVDEARNLTRLKEFSKTCRIKKIELEKPDARVYRYFHSKYKNSNYNIYNIELAINSVLRNIDMEKYTEQDVNAFFIAFCKQTKSYRPENTLEHAYMYYVIYYACMLDGDKSDVYKNNILEVIDNLKQCNNM